MGEFDFDELDKAVNDLMTNVDTSKRSDGTDDPIDKVVTIPTSIEPELVTVPVAATTPQTPTVTTVDNSEVVTKKTVPTPPLAMRRRGQFMDFVHPTHNMKNSPKFTNQHGATIRPLTNVEPLATEVASDIAKTTPVNQAEAVATDSTSEPEWPDPIDMASEPATAEQSDEAEITLVNGLEATSADDSTSYSSEPAPLTSPFLSDTKVEKRPLGSAGPSADAQPEANPDEADANTDAELKTQVPATPPVVLPAELSGDVMAVESKDLSTQPEAARVLSPPLQPDSKVSNNATTLSSKGSITQQYTEQPSTGDQTSGSMYDTATYHQAIDSEKPVKKSSPLKWIIWIVVLLLVGAAAGAAYFYFTR